MPHAKVPGPPSRLSDPHDDPGRSQTARRRTSLPGSVGPVLTVTSKCVAIKTVGSCNWSTTTSSQPGDAVTVTVELHVPDVLPTAVRSDDPDERDRPDGPGVVAVSDRVVPAATPNEERAGTGPRPVHRWSLIVILGFAALVVDLGMLRNNRQTLANTMDAGALAGGTLLPVDGTVPGAAAAINALIVNDRAARTSRVCRARPTRSATGA